MIDMNQQSPKSPMAERILLKMKELDYNAKRLSIEAGLNETYVRDLLKADNPNPRFQHLQALADKLQVSVEWLGSGRESAEIVGIWDRIMDRQDKKLFRDFGQSLTKNSDEA